MHIFSIIVMSRHRGNKKDLPLQVNNFLAGDEGFEPPVLYDCLAWLSTPKDLMLK